MQGVKKHENFHHLINVQQKTFVKSVLRSSKENRAAERIQRQIYYVSHIIYSCRRLDNYAGRLTQILTI